MIFVDTGAFIARYVRRDQFHAVALDRWRRVRERALRCYTSNFVLDETFTLLARKTDYEFAAERARLLLSAKFLLILRPDPSDELAAIDLFKKYSDQRVSFTDCVSFVLMRRYGVRRAFTFDGHFAIAGFEVWP